MQKADIQKRINKGREEETMQRKTQANLPKKGGDIRNIKVKVHQLLEKINK